MSLINPSNLYTAGSTVFNQSPHTQLMVNLMAKKQAKDEAMETYYRDLDTKINPAGMRTQDIPVLMENEGKRKEYFRANKAAILNPSLDNGRAQADFQSMYQGSHAAIQQSKAEAEKYKHIVPILTDPNKRSRVTPAFMEQLKLHDLPINDPTRKSLDPSAIDFTTPFDQSKFVKTFEDIERMPGATVVNRDTKNMLRTINTEYSYDDRGKEAIANRAVGYYNSDIGFQDMIDGLAKDPKQFEELNNFYKGVFGQPIDIAHPEELAVAYTIRTLQPTVTKTKVEDDKMAYDDYNFEQAKKLKAIDHANSVSMEKLRQANRKAIKDYGATKDATAKEGVLNNFISTQFEDGKEQTLTVDGQKYDGKIVKMPAFYKEKNKVVQGDAYVYPDEFMITKDKKYVIPIFKNGHTPSGNPTVNKQFTKPMLMADYKASLGKEWLTRKDAAEEMDDDFEDTPPASNRKPAKSNSKKGELD